MTDSRENLNRDHPAPQGAGPVDPEPAKLAGKRIDSIDLLRGIVIVIMMLER